MVRTRLIAASVMAVAMMMLTAGTDGATFRHCWMFFGTVDDTGFTHAVNLGRVTTHAYLTVQYPTHIIETRSYGGTFFMSAVQREAIINRSIADGCHAILQGGTSLFNGREIELAQRFPNITFAMLVDEMRPGLPPNLVEQAASVEFPAYVIGAAASAHVSTCVGLISAFEAATGVWGSTMGFAMGFLSTGSTLPMHIITMNSYFNPDAEVLAAQLLVEKGCEVIARRTDPNAVDKAMLQLSGRVLTVAPHVDMSLFVGDTVLSSTVVDFSLFYKPLLRAAFEAQLANSSGAVLPNSDIVQLATGKNPGVVATTLSPFVGKASSTAADAARARVDNHTGDSFACQPMRYRDGSPIVPKVGTNCVNPASAATQYLDLGQTATFYDAFVDGGALCDGPRYFTYDNVTLAPTCHRCEPNTIRPSSQTRARRNGCTPCSLDRVSSPDMTECIPPKSSDQSTTVIGVATGVGLAVVLAAVGAAVLMRLQGRDNSCAPKDMSKPIAVIFTDIKSSTTLWATTPAMAEAVEAHHSIIREVIREFDGYEVKTVGDAFMIVHTDATQTLRLALRIQDRLFEFDWSAMGGFDIDNTYKEGATAAAADDAQQKVVEVGGLVAEASTSAVDCSTLDEAVYRKSWNGIRVRIGVHIGHADGALDPVTKGWDYYGTTVNAAARIEDAAHGGQIAVSQILLDAVDSPFRTELTVKDHGPTSLRGLPEPLVLCTVSSKQASFAPRDFPPLRVDAEGTFDDENCSDNSGSTDTETRSWCTSESFSEGGPDFVERAQPQSRMDWEMYVGVARVYGALTAAFEALDENTRRDTMDALSKKWNLGRVPRPLKRFKGAHGTHAPAVMQLAVRAERVGFRTAMSVARKTQQTAFHKRPSQAQPQLTKQSSTPMLRSPSDV